MLVSTTSKVELQTQSILAVNTQGGPVVQSLTVPDSGHVAVTFDVPVVQSSDYAGVSIYNCSQAKAHTITGHTGNGTTTIIYAIALDEWVAPSDQLQYLNNDLTQTC